MSTLTRKQIGMLAVAKGLARGLSVEKTAQEFAIHPAEVDRYRRRLRHLTTVDELKCFIDTIDAAQIDTFLVMYFSERKREENRRRRAARKAQRASVYVIVIDDGTGQCISDVMLDEQRARKWCDGYNHLAAHEGHAWIAERKVTVPQRRKAVSV